MAKIMLNGVDYSAPTASSNDYSICSTAAATAAKVVTCTGFTLISGAKITVKFTVTNTAANPTLNVNNTGAKPIYYKGSAVIAKYLAANCTYSFRYNGAQYDLVGDLDTNTTYTHPTTSGNKHIPSGGSSGQILRWGADGTAVWGADNNTTYGDMTASTASAAGQSGLVPAPTAGAQNKYLTGGAIWQNVDDHVATFTSGDSATPTGFSDVEVIQTGEKHSSLWNKFSLVAKNMRYIWKLLNAVTASGAITEVKIVNTLPTDASNHPTTFYWVKG